MFIISIHNLDYLLRYIKSITITSELISPLFSNILVHRKVIQLRKLNGDAEQCSIIIFVGVRKRNLEIVTRVHIIGIKAHIPEIRFI